MFARRYFAKRYFARRFFPYESESGVQYGALSLRGEATGSFDATLVAGALPDMGGIAWGWLQRQRRPVRRLAAQLSFRGKGWGQLVASKVSEASVAASSSGVGCAAAVTIRGGDLSLRGQGTTAFLTSKQSTAATLARASATGSLRAARKMVSSFSMRALTAGELRGHRHEEKVFGVETSAAFALEERVLGISAELVCFAIDAAPAVHRIQIQDVAHGIPEATIIGVRCHASRTDTKCTSDAAYHRCAA